MFTAKQLRDLVTANPFHPFRIYMSDGSHYDVRNRDTALVERNTVDIGLDLDSDGFPGSLARCSILHIVRVEDLQASVQP